MNLFFAIIFTPTSNKIHVIYILLSRQTHRVTSSGLQASHHVTVSLPESSIIQGVPILKGSTACFSNILCVCLFGSAFDTENKRERNSNFSDSLYMCPQPFPCLKISTIQKLFSVIVFHQKY